MATTHDFKCKEPGCDFVSTGWRTKTLAGQRGADHKREHESGEPMAELGDFRKAHREQE